MRHKLTVISAACFVAGAIYAAPAFANEFTNWMPSDRKSDGTGNGHAVGGDAGNGDTSLAPPGSSADSPGVYRPIAKVKPKSNEKKYSPIGGPFGADGKPIAKPRPKDEKYSPIGGPFTGDGTATGGNEQYSPIGRPPASVGGSQYSPIGVHPTAPADKCTRGIPRMCNDGSIATVSAGSCQLVCPEDNKP